MSTSAIDGWPAKAVRTVSPFTGRWWYSRYGGWGGWMGLGLGRFGGPVHIACSGVELNEIQPSSSPQWSKRYLFNTTVHLAIIQACFCLSSQVLLVSNLRRSNWKCTVKRFFKSTVMVFEVTHGWGGQIYAPNWSTGIQYHQTTDADFGKIPRWWLWVRFLVHVFWYCVVCPSALYWSIICIWGCGQSKK